MQILVVGFAVVLVVTIGAVVYAVATEHGETDDSN